MKHKTSICALLAVASAMFLIGCDFGPPSPPENVVKMNVHTPLYNMGIIQVVGFNGFFAIVDGQPGPIFITVNEYRDPKTEKPVSFKPEEVETKFFSAEIQQLGRKPRQSAVSKQRVPIPGAMGFGKGKNPPGDILAFEVTDVATYAHPYPLAPKKPQHGEYVWLIGILNNTQLMAAKYVSDENGYMKLEWDKDLKIPDFWRSTGMPYVNQNGEVVGFTVHTYSEGGHNVALLNPVDGFLPPLKEALGRHTTGN